MTTCNFFTACLSGVTDGPQSFTGLLGIDLRLDSLTQDETVCFPVRQSVLKLDSLSPNKTVCPVLTLVPHIKLFVKDVVHPGEPADVPKVVS